jgi:hypothetical protein
MLAGGGYRGVFGADLVLSEERAVLVDLNPRFQGSTCLLSEIQALAGDPSVADCHTVACLEWPRPMPRARAPSPAAAAAQVVLYHWGEEAAASGALDAGVYSLAAGELTRVRDGLGTLDIEFPANEFVITGGVPRRGLSLRPGAQVCRIGFRQRIYDPCSRELTAFARAAIAAARSRLAEAAAASAGGGPAVGSAINVEYTGGQEQC